MNERIAGKEKIAEYFEGLFEKYGDDYRSLEWKSKESQTVRFSVLLDIVSFVEEHKQISILDVGCGLGHFYDFLKTSGMLDALKITYCGIDISKKLIDFAKTKHNGIDFRVVDVINDKFSEEFDYVMSSGAFNIKMTDLSSHKETIVKMLTRMYSISRLGMAVNFLSRVAMYLIPEERNEEKEKFVYFTEEEVTSWVKAIGNRYILRRDYHPGDFTVYMLK